MATSELSILLKLRDEASAELGKVKENISGLGPVLKGAGIGILAIGAAAVGAGVASVKSFADTGDMLQKMAIKTGISTEALSGLKYAADLSGTSLETVGTAIKGTANFLQALSQDSAASAATMKTLGLSVEQLQGLSPEDTFNILSEAIADVENPLTRAAVAQDVFGRSGLELLPMLASGREGLQAMKDEAADLGLIFSQDAANSAAAFNDNLTKLQGAVQGLMNEVAAALMPALMPLIDAFVLLVKALPIKEIGKLIAELLPPLVDLFLQLLKAIPFDVLLKLVVTVLTPLLGIIKALLPALTPLIGIFAELMKLLTPVVEFIGKILEGVAKLVGGVLGTLFKGVGGVVSGISSLFGIHDGIVQNGQIITTDPADYIIATKTPGALMGGGGGSPIYITVQGSVVSENQLIDVVRRGLYRDQSRNYSLGLA